MIIILNLHGEHGNDDCPNLPATSDQGKVEIVLER